MPTRYVTGRNVEYAAKKFLEENGYHVLRSAGSKGAFDLVAFNDSIVRFIQCKSSDSDKGYNQELIKIKAVQTPENCTRELWFYLNGSGFTSCRVVGGAVLKSELHFPRKAAVLVV